jgi:hypothetical protein
MVKIQNKTSKKKRKKGGGNPIFLSFYLQQQPVRKKN